MKNTRYFLDTTMPIVISDIHHELRIDDCLTEHKGKDALAHYSARRNPFVTPHRHHVLWDFQGLVHWMTRKPTALHFLAYSATGSSMAVDFRTQTDEGSTSDKFLSVFANLRSVRAEYRILVLSGKETEKYFESIKDHAEMYGVEVLTVPQFIDRYREFVAASRHAMGVSLPLAA